MPNPVPYNANSSGLAADPAVSSLDPETFKLVNLFQLSIKD